MQNTALYNLAPLASMLLAGLVLALAPLAWVAWRHRQGTPVGRVKALTWITLFLTFDLVLFGAFTRLTDSGLGCPDWPGCYGSASPFGASANIQVAESALPGGPVTQRKAWIEMIHRYLATGVGALILFLAVFSWTAKPTVAPANSGPAEFERARLRTRRWWAAATLIWVCIQGAFGALTVTMKLFPAIVTLHLLGGMVLLALLTVQVAGTGSAAVVARQNTHRSQFSGAVARLLWFGFAALALQIALGGWVSTNYAVLACSDFPRCQGSFWPPMDFARGFEVWRPLGLKGDAVSTGSAEHIPFAALTAIHFVHRSFALVVLVVLGALAWQLNRQSAAQTSWRAASRWLAGLLGLQVATGLANVLLGWPLLAAVLHTGGAAALVVVLTWIACLRSPAVQNTGQSEGNNWAVAA
jgi:heme a synthase